MKGRLNYMTCWFVVTLFVVVSQTTSAQSYRIVNLGTLGGESSGAQSIDNDGRVVGWSVTNAGQRHGFLYSDGILIDIGALPGGSESVATAVNERRIVVGYSGINQYGRQYDEVTQAFIWSNGRIESLGALYCPCDFNTRYGSSEAYGVNETGQVVGSAETRQGPEVHHAFLWEEGVMQDIGGGRNDWSISRAFDINSESQIVGYYAQDAGRRETGRAYERYAFLWENGRRELIGTLPGHSSSVALAVNNRTQIVGWSGSAEGLMARAFLWSDREMRDLGTLEGHEDSRALGINNQGEIVGWSGRAELSLSRAVLWNQGTTTDLNETLSPDSGWVLLEAAGISDNGDIVGTGIWQGEVRAFMLLRRG